MSFRHLLWILRVSRLALRSWRRRRCLVVDLAVPLWLVFAELLKLGLRTLISVRVLYLVGLR